MITRKTDASWRSRPITEAPPGAVRPLRRSEPPPKPSGERAAFLADVVAGLSRAPKALPARYLFDAVGARLFGCLAANESYSISKSELAVLGTHGEEIARALGEGVQLVDLACGDGTRTALLATRLASPARIVVVDRLLGAASRAAASLSAVLPELAVQAAEAQGPWSMHLPSCPQAKRTVAYLPASLIGELEPREAKQELGRLREECGPGGGLLVAVDLEKSADELEAPLADHAGVSSAFALNLLARINRELCGSFQLAAFDPRASYDPVKNRVELQLVSKRWQWAAVHGHWFNFGAGETITTLVAYKYTVEWFRALATSAGWNVARVLQDPERKYALVLLEA